MIVDILKNIAITVVCAGGIYYNRHKIKKATTKLGNYSSSLYTTLRLLNKTTNDSSEFLSLIHEITHVVGYNETIHADLTNIFKMFFFPSDGSFKIPDEICDALYPYNNFVIYYSFKINTNNNLSNNPDLLSEIEQEDYAIIVPAKFINEFKMPLYSVQDLELANGISWDDVWDEILIKTDNDVIQISDFDNIDTLIMHSGPLKDFYESIMPNYVMETDWKHLINYPHNNRILTEENSSIYITSMIGHTKHLN